MITTFEELIKDSRSQKTALVEIQPTKNITSWTQYSGSIYVGSMDPYQINEVSEDGVALASAPSIASMTSGTFFRRTPNIYVWPTSDVPQAHTMLVESTVFYSNRAVVFNDNFYEPVVRGIPVVTQSKPELFYAISIISDGTVSMYNSGGFFDEIFRTYIWNQKPITIKIGGENLPYSEYSPVFTGIVKKFSWKSDMVKVDFVDSKVEWETSLIKNTYSVEDFPYMDPDLEGTPISIIYGSVKKVPCIAINSEYTATSVYSFKFADASVGSVRTLSQVYVGGIPVSHSATNTTAATFSLSSATWSDKRPDVSADVEGCYSGTVLIDNPIDVMRGISGLLGIDYAESWDTAAAAVARQDCEDLSFTVGLVIDSSDKSALEYASLLMQSCLGSFFLTNDGKYSVSIFDVDVASDAPVVNEVDIKERSFSASLETAEIRSLFSIGWARLWDSESHSFVTDSNSDTTLLYGITRSRNINTLLTSIAGATNFLDRIGFIYSTASTKMKMVLKLQLASLNIGDRFSLFWKRRQKDSYPSWLSGINVEILEIVKNFEKNTLSISVDDLKGIGASAGHWTANPPAFPGYIGGGDGSPWDSGWNSVRKSYAKQNWGYWTDDNGYADPADEETRLISRWW